MELLSGRVEGIPFSLSRWTDVCADRSKWTWFKAQLEQGKMTAFDPRTALPREWSLRPEDSLGMVFWTKDPTNLIENDHLFRGHKLKIHVTVTGWDEVERHAPSQGAGARLLARAADTFGPENVIWRFSPVPLVKHVIVRFHEIAAVVKKSGVRRVYLSFLQDNDRLPETRTREERLELLVDFAKIAQLHKMQVYLCNEDRLLAKVGDLPENLSPGVCQAPEDFELAGFNRPPSEGCGCVLMADPFTINESCSVGCEYCLAPDTPVMHRDFQWRPLGDIRVGDTLIGFDEEPPQPREDRKFRQTIVEGVWRSHKPVIRVVTESTEVLTTAEHLWFEGKTRKSWKRTDHLALDCKLHKFEVARGPRFSMNYKAGYITGMTLGDGTCRLSETRVPQSYWRVALSDVEPLTRLKSYLQDFGVAVDVRPFDSGSALTRKPMQKVETRAREAIRKVASLDQTPETDEFMRGFLAGLYDAEGSYNKSVRIHQKKVNGLLERASRYAASLGVSLPVEGNRMSVRVQGGLRQHCKFFTLIEPALLRKTSHFFGRSIDFSKDPIVAIEKVGVREVIDIRTSTRTFLAAGLATHNCYAADKNLSDKKRNTTRLTVLR